MTLTLKSPAFAHNDSIPSKFTCDGENISPALTWQNAPDTTESFALIMDDPDAPVGNWDHWLLYNIPANMHDLPEDFISPPNGIQTGKNSWGKSSYGGPCPPDREHRYFFKLYALDTKLNLSHPTKSQLEEAMKEHVIESATLIGKYNRKHR